MTIYCISADANCIHNVGYPSVPGTIPLYSVHWSQEQSVDKWTRARLLASRPDSHVMLLNRLHLLEWKCGFRRFSCSGIMYIWILCTWTKQYSPCKTRFCYVLMWFILDLMQNWSSSVIRTVHFEWGRRTRTREVSKQWNITWLNGRQAWYCQRKWDPRYMLFSGPSEEAVRKYMEASRMAVLHGWKKENIWLVNLTNGGLWGMWCQTCKTIQTFSPAR